MAKPPKGLSIRQKRAVKFRLKGHSKQRAAKLAGYKANGAAIFARPLVQSALTQAMQKQGITLGKLVKPIKDALGANKVVVFMGKAEETDIPDHQIRLEAAELGISLHGGLPKQVELPPAPQEPLTVIFESEGHARTAIQIGARPPLSTRERAEQAQEESVKLILDE